jgi:DNA anti-recombination protein RmuC
MSVRTELEELFKWISDLSVATEPKSAPPGVYRENWHRVVGNLTDATDTFAEIGEVLRAGRAKSVLVDFAHDLERQADDLALHARVLERRARRKPIAPRARLTETEKELAEKTKELDETEKKLAERKRELREIQKEIDDAKTKLATRVVPEKPVAEAQGIAPEESLAKLLGLASRRLETAHENIFEGVEHPDAAARAFTGELEALAEMTLSLRQQYEEYERAGSPPDVVPVRGSAVGRAWRRLLEAADQTRWGRRSPNG